MTSTPPSDVLGRFVSRARRLYTLPAVAMRVVELTSAPRVDARAVKECVENDPALTAKILRVVNSSLFGLARQVTDLNQALALLGTKPLKMLVLGFSLPRELFAGLEAEVLDRYWRRTLIKAVAAREVSERVWGHSGDEAFLAGLLQDIGMLALIQDLGEPYVHFLERVHVDGGDLPALELETLGFDHTVLSARLLDAWGLPNAIVDAVGSDRTTDLSHSNDGSPPALPQILHLAAITAKLLIEQRPESLDELLETGSRYRGMTMPQVEATVSAVDDKVPPLADVLSLQLPGELDYTSVLLRAHDQLSSLAEAPSAFESPRYPLAEREDLSRAVRRISDEPQQPTTRESTAVATRSHSSHVVGSRESATPPMLGSKIDPGFHGAVEASIANCRQSRQPISLVLLELDDAESLVMRSAPDGAAKTVARLRDVIESILDGEGRVYQVDDFRFGAILEHHDRHPAVEISRRIAADVRRWGEVSATTMSGSLGVATLSMPPKNFPSRELIDAAERCLGGAQLSGGDAVKSIEIY